MSKLCDQVIEVISELFPGAKIKTEEYVLYKNQRLFIDIYLPQFGIAIEVHGKQHDQYVDHFHGSSQNFKSYKKRDSLKEEWASDQGLVYVVLRRHQLPVTKDSLLEEIDAAANNERH